MYRFLLPAFVMISAIVVLLAGALGGIPALPDLPGQWAAYFTTAAPEHTVATSTPVTPAASEPPSTPDASQQQAAQLQGQIAQRSRELASLNSSKDQARHELDALHQQRQTEEAAIAQLQAQQKQMAAAEPRETPAKPQPVPQSAPAPSGNPPIQTSPRATAQYPRRQTPPRRVASQPEQTQTPRDDLENARTLLVSGRAADARQMLVVAQARSELHQVTPDQPFATGGSLAATRISDAIRYLDRGNTRYALREINIAMNGSTTATRTSPAYPSSTPQGRHYPPQPVYDGGNAQR